MTNEKYCFCADCIRCGCGMWEKHHKTEAEILSLTDRLKEVKDKKA